jgi:hypothetical protein
MSVLAERIIGACHIEMCFCCCYVCDIYLHFLPVLTSFDAELCYFDPTTTQHKK